MGWFNAFGRPWVSKHNPTCFLYLTPFSPFVSDTTGISKLMWVDFFTEAYGSSFHVSQKLLISAKSICHRYTNISKEAWNITCPNVFIKSFRKAIKTFQILSTFFSIKVMIEKLYRRMWILFQLIYLQLTLFSHLDCQKGCKYLYLVLEHKTSLWNSQTM